MDLAVETSRRFRLDREAWPIIETTNALRLTRRVFPRHWVCLGRYGDLCIALRGLKLIADWTGQGQDLIVSRQFADFLDGFSFVNPIPIRGDWFAIPEARAVAGAMWPGEPPCVIQCNGLDWNAGGVYASYHLSMWDRMGLPVELVRTAPLSCDQRNTAREAALLAQVGANGLPLLLYNFTGFTSPFIYGPHIELEFRRSHSRSFHCVNLGLIRAVRAFDLLGLYDRAAVIITSDTLTLHLAAGSRTPLIAYTNNRDKGSIVPDTCVLETRYAETMASVSQLHAVLREIAAGRAAALDRVNTPVALH